jgi:hypothetical protein
MKNTIVYFHIGRGGRFHNSGYKTFRGEKNIEQVLQMADSSGQWSFPAKENESEIRSTLEKRDLTNLLELFDRCNDADDFSAFEKRTGFELGEDIYVNHNGEPLITKAEAETGIGSISWDGDYDTDTCHLLSDCDKAELQLIADSNEWNKNSLIQQYFDENTELVIDWAKFNGNYSELIAAHFDSDFETGFTEIEEFYEIQETN